MNEINISFAEEQYSHHLGDQTLRISDNLDNSERRLRLSILPNHALDYF